MPKLIDLTGKRFGKLTVINRIEDKRNGAWWLCRCDCGKEKVIKGQSLRDGLSHSCGCGIAESNSQRFKTHGMSRTRLYRIWVNMHRRCEYEKNGGYAYCGAKGIRVCEEWKDFQTFRDWAYAKGYEETLTIDRIDNSKNYCPENCRWVSMKTQENNRDNCHYITFNGETHTLTEWAEITGINKYTLSYRINQAGWSLERALCR